MANQLSLSGVIKQIDDAQQVTEKLTKRQVVLTTAADKYPQDVAFEFINDACDALDRFAPGMEVDIFFNVRGREYNGKYYTNLSGWKIESTTGAGAAPAAAAKPATANKNPSLRAQPSAAPIASDDDNDLPF